ncbi:hypothetical protein Sinac_6867 [Singulisphaera acidiphila DSM 18658]|uniref:Uncharacterized protein n=1 Tax=Singulisphaera acidiphila (strain ATCC BAA-1392 / DSM 18658 / VKM B-2454 / MOB10) TaxID=886293 RepID=L0DNV5_SINAD|nr:hypothetical protein Sinac_6867 [Singulisphaera acidiphila DSM 18658]
MKRGEPVFPVPPPFYLLLVESRTMVRFCRGTYFFSAAVAAEAEVDFDLMSKSITGS